MAFRQAEKRRRWSARQGWKTSSPLLLIFLLGGCADPWDKYEDSLYGALRDPSPGAQGGHAELLGEIVQRFDTEKRKPPPGILAEYGLYLARMGYTEESKRYLRAEKEAYPESAVFVTAMERAIEGHRAFEPVSPEAPKEP